MLKLIVGDQGKEVQSATVPVRWCVDKETLNELKKEGVTDPYLLLVTTGNGRELSRQLAPLSQLMDFVALRHPGRNTIYATIVFAVDKEDNESVYGALHRMFLRKSRRYYDSDVISYDGNFIKEIKHSGCICNLEFVETDVMVPEELFAKKPSKWEERWINLWFEDTKIKDQCQFRRRRILAYTIQPLAVSGWIIMRFLMGLICGIFHLGILGHKKTDFRPLIHPWRYDLSEIWHNVGKSFLNSVFLWPFSPIVFCVTIFISNALNIWTHRGLSLWEVMGLASIINLGVAFIYYVGLIVAVMFVFSTGWTIEKIKAEWLTKKKQMQDRQKEIIDEGWLLCDKDLTPSIRALPEQKRTVYLRYMDLKAKVCRPFPE
jgi:hypothetical protein